MAHVTGRRIVQMVKDDLKPSDILTKPAFENAIRVNGAIGGSTNAVIHLLAIAGRVGLDLTLDDWDRLGRDIPTIVDLMPSGRFLMEEFFYAGGLPVVIRALGEAGHLHKDALTVSGGPIWDEVRDVRNWNEEVIRPAGRALTAERRHRRAARQPRPGRRGAEALGRLAAPAAAPRPGGGLRGHRRLQGPDQRRGARHRRDLRDGAEDLRPARLSGHGRGRQHGAAAQGAEEGDHRHGADLRRPDVGHRLRHRRAARRARGGARRPARGGADRRHDRARRARRAGCTSTSRPTRSRAGSTDWTPPVPRPDGGYAQLYHDHVGGADTGADLDFLKGCRGHAVGRESH